MTTKTNFMKNYPSLGKDAENQDPLPPPNDEDQDPPPPPPKDSEQNKKKKLDSDASASTQPPAHTSSTWTTTDTRDTPSSSSKQHQTSPSGANWFRPILEKERPATPKLEWSIPPNDFTEADVSWANDFATTYQDPKENKLFRKTGDMGSFIKWFCKRIGKKKLNKSDLEGLAFNMVKGFHKNSISIQFQMEECHKLLIDKVDLVNPKGHGIMPDISKPLPLGGPPRHVSIQPQFFFNKDLEYLLSGDKYRKTALSISKLKAAYYSDLGLEELVPSLWIESEHQYDISAAYGITHWWFRRKEFYINKHRVPSDLDAVRSHMQIISVISLKSYERYGYNYLLEIVIHRADYKEDRNNQKKMMQISEVHKFSDRTLTRIRDKLDFMVKDYVLFKYNPRMEKRIWTENDKMRSQYFIKAIERIRIFRSLESVVSGRLRDIDYRLITRTE
nr:hypothetical protein [Tanacetum cinerariifolium]